MNDIKTLKKNIDTHVNNVFSLIKLSLTFDVKSTYYSPKSISKAEFETLIMILRMILDPEFRRVTSDDDGILIEFNPVVDDKTQVPLVWIPEIVDNVRSYDAEHWKAYKNIYLHFKRDNAMK